MEKKGSMKIRKVGACKAGPDVQNHSFYPSDRILWKTIKAT